MASIPLRRKTSTITFHYDYHTDKNSYLPRMRRYHSLYRRASFLSRWWWYPRHHIQDPRTRRVTNFSLMRWCTKTWIYKKRIKFLYSDKVCPPHYPWSYAYGKCWHRRIQWRWKVYHAPERLLWKCLPDMAYSQTKVHSCKSWHYHHRLTHDPISKWYNWSFSGSCRFRRNSRLSLKTWYIRSTISLCTYQCARCSRNRSSSYDGRVRWVSAACSHKKSSRHMEWREADWRWSYHRSRGWHVWAVIYEIIVNLIVWVQLL